MAVLRRPWYKLSFARAAFRPVCGGPCVIPDLSVLWVIFFVLLMADDPEPAALQATDPGDGRTGSGGRLRAAAGRARGDAGARGHRGIRRADARGTRRGLPADGRSAPCGAGCGAAELLAETRQQAEALDCRRDGTVRADAAEARARLDRDADILATTIVERVLGRLCFLEAPCTTRRWRPEPATLVKLGAISRRGSRPR